MKTLMNDCPTESATALELTALPAEDGDCLVLSYGTKPRRRAVVDAGRRATYRHLRERMKTWASEGDRFMLLVITHFDGDHIEGVLEMVEDPALPIMPEEVWFNGYDEVVAELQPLDAEDADELSEAMTRRKWPVNQRFGGRRISIPASGLLPTVSIEGGLEVTLLSPDDEALDSLIDDWDEVRRGAKPTDDVSGEEDDDLQSLGGISKPLPDPLDVVALAAARNRRDDGKANRASIAFLAQCGGRSVLFAADAHPDVIVRSLARLNGPRPVVVDVAKLSHHGSKKNNPSSFFETIECRRYLISSSGRRQSHPDPETIARILTSNEDSACTFYFNYQQRWAELWNEADIRGKHGHACVFPDGRDLTIIV